MALATAAYLAVVAVLVLNRPAAVGAAELDEVVRECQADPPEYGRRWVAVRITPTAVTETTAEAGSYMRVEQAAGATTFESRVGWTFRDRVRVGEPIVLWGPIARCEDGRLTMAGAVPAD